MGGKNAAEKAARQQAKASKAGTQEIRRQFETTRADLTPFRNAGRAALGDVRQAATIEGLGARLGEIFGSGALDPLIAERTTAARGQLGAAGLQRSGTALEQIAAIPTELGFAVEELLSGRSSALANLGLGAATQTGAFGAQAAGGIASGLSQAGQAQASGTLGAQQAQSAGLGQLAGIAGGLGQAGLIGSGLASGLGAGIGVLGLALSDPRLKKNVVKLAQINDLGVYQWDWIDELEGTKAAESPTIGFMADEVEEKYPQFTETFGGFRTIAYAPLLALMEYKADQILEQEAA